VTISAHLTTFAGQPVQDWQPDSGPIEPTIFYRVSLVYDAAESGQQWSDCFAELLDHPGAEALEGIVVGTWGEMFDDQEEATRVVEALVAARDRLPQLRAIFLGDITYEECEISWIQNTDVSPIFDAYPALEHFAVRGTNGLRLGALRHQRLRSLAVQSGGLDAAITHEVSAAELPALEHLELWLGTSEYGGTTTLDDLAPILSGARFPKLTYLGLRDSEIADVIAGAAATAPVLDHLRILDLSLGTLGDQGAAALLASPAVARLEKLDIHHHYCSTDMVERLQGLGIEVDASEQEEEDEDAGERYRYVSVSE
jgi:Leucine Rich repeat